MYCRHVHVAERESVPPSMAAFLEFLHSEPLCRLLSHLTGLDLAGNLIRPGLTATDAAGSPSHCSCGSAEQAMCAQIEPEMRHNMETATAPEEIGGRHRPSASSAESSKCGHGSEAPERVTELGNGSSISTSGQQGQSSPAQVRGELLCFRPGDYTLASDQDPSLGESELHLLMFFNCYGEQPHPLPRPSPYCVIWTSQHIH